MKQSFDIYGIKFTTPEVPKSELIANHDKPKYKQKFYRVQIPESFDELEYDDEDKPVYEPRHLSFIEQEINRIDNGYWFYNFGKATYLTGLNYFYLNYWRLENGDKPDYRETDKEWFYFEHYCESQNHIDGVIRSKNRRRGATSQATASLVRTAITQVKSFCGIVSKGNIDAKTCFIDMVSNGYKELPEYLKVDCEDEDSKTALIFQKKKNVKLRKNKSRGQLHTKSRGIGSRIDFRPTALNSYDSGRLTKVLIDEGGKNPPEVPIEEYWPIVQQTLKQGSVRVGFALMPSTCNEGEKGGRGFKVLWDNSNQLLGLRTGTGLYRYFSPAFEGYMPYIDEYGFSITEKPTKTQAEWMKKYYHASDFDCSMGSRERILYDRSLITNEKMRHEHIRMYPMSEREAFDFEESQNIYDVPLLTDQKEYLLGKPPKVRKVRFFKKSDGTVDFIDDQNGLWHFLYLPQENETNKFYVDGKGKQKPSNTHKYTITVDPFKSTIKVGAGSMGAAFIGIKPNELDPENSGMPIGMFYGRPKFRNDFHNQIVWAGVYFGADLCYESDYDDYIEYFMGLGLDGYIKEKPVSAIDPNRKKKRAKQKEFGVKSADGFAYTSMTLASVEYVLLHSHKIYFMELIDDLLSFDPDDRTSHDLAVAFQILCLTMLTPVKKKAEVVKVQKYLKTYNLMAANKF